MVASVKKEVVGTARQKADVLQEFSLEPGEGYEITVVASNAVGNSSESNIYPVLFTAPTNSTTMAEFDTLLYLSVSSGVAIFIVGLLVIITIIFLYKSKFCSHGTYIGCTHTVIANNPI